MKTQQIMVSTANLSLQEQVELGRRMSEGDKSAREQLVLCCVPLVKFFTKTLLCTTFSSFDDMFQDGMLGTLEAVDKYDYTKDIMFTTFAYYYIHKRIMCGIVAQTPVKISDEDYFNSILLNSTVETFKAAHQVPPTDEQLSALTNIPLKTVKLLQSRNIADLVISLNTSGENMLSLPREDVCLVVERVLTESAQKQVVADALECLTDDEREIVLQRTMMRKPKKATLQQLADLQGVHIATVAKREKAAMRKLLAYFMKHKIDFDDLVV